MDFFVSYNLEKMALNDKPGCLFGSNHKHKEVAEDLCWVIGMRGTLEAECLFAPCN
jgi:hypothetical protein